MIAQPGYDVLIRNNATGEERWVHQDLPWDDSSVFWWTEGNMGCDCNRRIQFHGTRSEDSECGQSAYAVLFARLSTGELIKLDED